MHIGNTVKHDIRYSKIPFETIYLVRKYRIHKWPRKLGQNQPSIKQLKVNATNLVSIEIKKEDQTITNNLRIATVNTRSIINKSELVMETSKLESVDMLAITETWLTGSEEDKAWVKTSGLDGQEYTFHSHSRIDR